MRSLIVSLVSVVIVGSLFVGAPAPIRAAANDIYVGSADDSTGASSCDDPDFSTDPSDEASINAAIVAALLEVDDDGDIVIICEGEYLYADDIEEHDGGVDWGVINIEAEAGADVVLAGDEAYQLFNFTGMETVSITGVAFLDAQVTGSGAAIAFDGDALTVSDCSFSDGSATVSGPAIHVNEGDLTVDSCDFLSNDSAVDGAIWVSGGAEIVSVEVTDSSFTDNGIGEGAAISVDGASGSLISAIDSEFINNDGNYGAITIDGGGVELTRVLMEGNDASGEDGGAVWAGEYLTVEDSVFRNNTGENGGAIYVNGDVTIRGSSFDGNVAGVDGGAIYTDGGDVNIGDSRFTDNRATEGGGIYVFDCLETSIEHNTFLRNVSEDDGGGAINFECEDTSSEAQIADNRFERNVAASYGGATDDDEAKVLVYTRNVFVRNQAVGVGADGGAVWVNQGRFYRNRFVGNSATHYGGAIYIVGRSDGGTARRNTFQSNRAIRGAQYYNAR